MERRPSAGLSRITRERFEELARLGPWDLEKDWAPTAEMKARERLPFWFSEPLDVRRSIGELYSGFRLRSGVVAFKTFDANRTPSGPSHLSAGETAVCERFAAWLWTMQAEGQKRYIPTVQGVLLHETPCLDERRFLAVVDLHVEIRKRDTAGKPLLSQRAFAMKRVAAEERERVVRSR